MFSISTSDNFCNQANFINTKIRNLHFQKENEEEGKARGSFFSLSLGICIAIPFGGRQIITSGPSKAYLELRTFHDVNRTQ